MLLFKRIISVVYYGINCLRIQQVHSGCPRKTACERYGPDFVLYTDPEDSVRTPPHLYNYLFLRSGVRTYNYQLDDLREVCSGLSRERDVKELALNHPSLWANRLRKNSYFVRL